jgi:hypothetical protein
MIVKIARQCLNQIKVIVAFFARMVMLNVHRYRKVGRAVLDLLY